MTVCIVVDCGSRAFLISDLLVTTSTHEKVLLPHSIGRKGYSGIKTPALLVSKSFQSDRDTLLGFAGSAARIREFMSLFPLHLAYGKGEPRPMRYVSDIVNTFNLDAPSPNHEISIVGFTVKSFLDRSINWILRETSVLRTGKFGKMFGEGSGARELSDKIVDLDKSLWMESEDLGGDRLTYLVGGINSFLLFAPSEFRPNRTWGGYLEISEISLEVGGIVPKSSWAHICYRIDISHKKATFGMLNKVGVYRPGTNSSDLIILLHKNSVWNAHTWVIPSGVDLEPKFDDENQSLEGFFPTFCSVLFEVRRGKRRWFRTTTLRRDRLKNLRFEHDKSGRFGIGLIEEYLESVAEEERSFVASNP